MPEEQNHKVEPCNYCQLYIADYLTQPGFKTPVNVCATTKGKSLGRGSMCLHYYEKGMGDSNEHWAIECPQTSDYQFIRFCPMCGRNLMTKEDLEKDSVVDYVPQKSIVKRIVEADAKLKEQK